MCGFRTWCAYACRLRMSPHLLFGIQLTVLRDEVPNRIHFFAGQQLYLHNVPFLLGPAL